MKLSVIAAENVLYIIVIMETNIHITTWTVLAMTNQEELLASHDTTLP